MNINTQLKPFRTVGVLLVSALAFSACEKESDNTCGGTPTITDVTLPTKRDTTVATGNLADWIIIRGNNFCGVKQVLLNDIEASLTDAYITSNEITLRIPRAVPKTVTNKIVVGTDGGTAEKAYTVSIPPLLVRGLSNEYAPAGQTVAIAGSNFDLYGVTPEKGKVMWAGTSVPITRATADSVFFVVPASAVPGATAKVTDANNKELAVPGRYKDDRNVVFGYDAGGSVWGGTTYITTGPTPAPVNGPFLRVNQAIGAWAWTEFSATNMALPADVVANPGNYVLKFEVNTLKPFSANVIKFMIDGDAASTNTYQWKPPVNTRGKWSTVGINMSEIVNKGLLASKAQHELKFIFHGDGALDADISFDTFRIVPKN